ncbi:MAG TPA: hypothetical protein PLK67_19830, partial [Bryobacteraceae bacterium]|nr:hypothetical protein [Bryobacteraceae bacterium]
MSANDPSRPLLPAIVAAGAVIIVGFWAVTKWLTEELPFELAERQPESEREAATAIMPAVDLRVRFERGEGVPSAITSAWPRFRGPMADGISREPVP